MFASRPRHRSRNRLCCCHPCGLGLDLHKSAIRPRHCPRNRLCCSRPGGRGLDLHTSIIRTRCPSQRPRCLCWPCKRSSGLTFRHLGCQVLLQESYEKGHAAFQARVRVAVESMGKECKKLACALGNLKGAEQQRRSILQDSGSSLPICMHCEAALLLQQLRPGVVHVELAIVQTTNLGEDLLEPCKPKYRELHVLECCVALQIITCLFASQEHASIWETRSTAKLSPKLSRRLQHSSKSWGTIVFIQLPRRAGCFERLQEFGEVLVQQGNRAVSNFDCIAELMLRDHGARQDLR
mmetsp:Transcript_40585/g.103125  ORF Transcript_40585/g.103125 Transcript_40585/m.103125 type:complete len:295 (+) Transcript_40585:534-1418(+)